jgi:XTP/dITP diphosphohydrolase
MRPDVLHIATTSPGKQRDFAAAAETFGIEIAPLPGLREIPEPVEDGATFDANARLKAEHYSRHAPGLWVLADDSGLEVDALNGAPGVRSARFAADESFAGEADMTTDERNNQCLLGRLRSAETETPGLQPLSSAQQVRGIHAPASTDENRTARYRCVLALARGGKVKHTAEGSVEGIILTAPRGDGGFGYDPLFLIPELNATMAEIDLATKQRISHRGRALESLLKELLLQDTP